MASHKQKKLWGYVTDRDLLQLKSYLKKHQDLSVNFSRGRRQRSPLHLACSLGDDGMMRLLLKHGADVLRKDWKGDTALHVAVNKALKYGEIEYNDFVVPLKTSCPEAMKAANKAGVTPEDLLEWMEHKEPADGLRSSSKCDPGEADPEKEWQQKLFDECEDEFNEAFGAFNDFSSDDDEEDFGDWADRIRREYFDKKHAEAQRLAASSSGWKRRKTECLREQKEKTNQILTDTLKRLQKEHEEYLARATRKAEETQEGKKRKYEEGCAATFHGSSSGDGKKLSYSDIPWPAPRGTVKEMVQVMLHGVDRRDTKAFCKALRRQQMLWHPDKFAQRCGARLEEKDKQRILDTVTALSQELNRVAQSQRT